MKKGKELNVKLHKKFRTSYGTIDNKNLKTIYVKVATWATPENEMEDYSTTILRLRKNIKNCVYQNINHMLFRSDIYIVDIDIKKSRITYNKSSYLSVEITLFVKNEGSTLTGILKSETTRLIGLIIDTIEKYNDFNYSYQKNECNPTETICL